MNAAKTRHLPEIAAKTVSVVFHPLLMPVYGLALILSAPSPLGYRPEHVKRILFTVMIINNVLLPMTMMPVFRYLNYITTWTMEERSERIIPLSVVTLLYAATSYIIYRFPIPVFLKAYIFSTLFLSLIITIVNFRWRISLHSVGAGALIALLLQLVFKLYSQMPLLMILSFIVAGMILSSRLYLKQHSPAEVWTGLFCGLAGFTLFMIVFQ